uniref:Copper transporter n=1 Tax=uncultured Nocardioidaceae bacterium TaxID=253824 RepID=A0A6J4LRL8_9ACTN|nr:MAG: FIG007481: hypothetical protein [uncultured Nocardioidaceae bacterium]
MIDFRYHLVSIVAIFLALATGIVLGSGPLGAELNDRLLGQGNQDKQTVAAQRLELAVAERESRFNDAFAEGVDEPVLDGLLEGNTVTVFTLPDANSTTVAAVIEELQVAGATVVGEVGVTSALLDPANRTTAQNLATQVLQGVEGVPTVAEAGSYEVVGYALAHGLLATSLTGTPVDPKSQEIQSAFAGADYLTYEGGEVQRRGGLAVLVAGAPDPSADPAQGEVLAAMLDSLDSMSAGVVLAGPLESAQGDGLLRGLLLHDAANHVSTVDMVDTSAGRVVTVMALAEQAAESSGHYGAGDGADQVLPELPEQPVDEAPTEPDGG